MDLDSALQVRHGIIHHNAERTYEDVKRNCNIVKEFVLYTDEVLWQAFTDWTDLV